MVRPRKRRRLRLRPHAFYFKPQGVPLYLLEEVELRPDELEALKLAHVDGLDQGAAARKMEISQPTFHRILDSAHQKVTEALVEGKAIQIRRRGGPIPRCS